MKLLIQNTRIIGIATDEYTGPEQFIDAPDDFNQDLMDCYCVIDGELKPVIPQIVTRFQARTALHLAGLLESVESMMQDENTPVLAKLAWNDASEFNRTSPTVQAMAAALELSETQIDELFISAAGITA